MDAEATTPDRTPVTTSDTLPSARQVCAVSAHSAAAVTPPTAPATSVASAACITLTVGSLSHSLAPPGRRFAGTLRCGAHRLGRKRVLRKGRRRRRGVQRQKARPEQEAPLHLERDGGVAAAVDGANDGRVLVLPGAQHNARRKRDGAADAVQCAAIRHVDDAHAVAHQRPRAAARRERACVAARMLRAAWPCSSE